MPLRASWMSLTLPLGRVRIALPLLVTWSLTPRGAGPWKAVGWPPAPTPPRPFAPTPPPARTPAPPVVVREPVVVVCVPFAVGPWLAPLAVGPCEVDAPVVVCDAPVAPPPVFAAGLTVDVDFAGGVFLLSAAALAMPTAPKNRPARTIATEPRLIVLRRSRIVILVAHFWSGYLFGPACQPEVANAYSTLLTFPLVRVTFMSL